MQAAPYAQRREHGGAMSDYAKSVGPRISKQVLKLRDRRLLEGAMATGALVALADKRLAVEESLALQAVLANAELLKIYDRELALSLYTRHIDRIRSDFAAGKEEAMRAIRVCSEDIEAAELIIQVGIAIAKADSEFSLSELEMIAEICAVIGVEGIDMLGLTGVSPRAMH
jgi:tellurite resistance protein